ncbi:U-box domain-containing protein 31 [Glycine max]|nr:U-box domain-containing protein 31 [Glycine max]
MPMFKPPCKRDGVEGQILDLDTMAKDGVLGGGVDSGTYERCNILKWISLGHFTCPTTMQELWDDSLTSNTTLHRLISTWISHK